MWANDLGMSCHVVNCEHVQAEDALVRVLRSMRSSPVTPVENVVLAALEVVLAGVNELPEVFVTIVAFEADPPRIRAFSDGSVLLTVGAGFVALLFDVFTTGDQKAVSRLSWGLPGTALLFIQFYRDRWAMRRWQKTPGQDPATLPPRLEDQHQAAIVRSLVLCRVSGLESIDISSDWRHLEGLNKAVAGAALCFVLAHELAHVVLGHGSRSVAALGRGQELEADLHGLSTLQHCGQPWRDLAYAGVLIAIGLVGITDDYVVRRARSHPDPGDRLDALESAALGPGRPLDISHVALWYTLGKGLVPGIRLRSKIDESAWQRVWHTADAAVPGLSPQAVSYAWELDRSWRLPVADLGRKIVGREEGLGELVSKQATSVAGLCGALDLDTLACSRMTDDRVPVSFADAVSYISSSSRLAHADNTNRRLTSAMLLRWRRLAARTSKEPDD